MTGARSECQYVLPALVTSGDKTTLMSTTNYTRNSVTLKQLVSTQIALSVPPAPIYAGQRLACSATVSALGAVLAGTVTFFIDGRAVRMANLVRGVANLVLPRGLRAGSHLVKAS